MIAPHEKVKWPRLHRYGGVGTIVCVLLVGVCLLGGASGCAGTRQLTDGLCAEDLLSVAYAVADPLDMHYRAFMGVVYNSQDFFVHFNRGRLFSEMSASTRFDGHYRVDLFPAAGECVVYADNMLLSQDAIADDLVQWVAILGTTEGTLDESLLKGGARCYFILIFRGQEPPHAILKVDHFESVRTARRGDALAFELTFTIDSKEMDFPEGKGKIVGILGRMAGKQPPVNF